MRTKCQHHLHDKPQSALDLACYPNRLSSILLVISGWGTTFPSLPNSHTERRISDLASKTIFLALILAMENDEYKKIDYVLDSIDADYNCMST